MSVSNNIGFGGIQFDPGAEAAPDQTVRGVQQALNRLPGGAGLREDGVFDAQTSQALRQFQHAAGLEVCGAINQPTIHALNLAVPPEAPPAGEPSGPPSGGTGLIQDQILQGALLRKQLEVKLMEFPKAGPLEFPKSDPGFPGAGLDVKGVQLPGDEVFTKWDESNGKHFFPKSGLPEGQLEFGQANIFPKVEFQAGQPVQTAGAGGGIWGEKFRSESGDENGASASEPDKGPPKFQLEGEYKEWLNENLLEGEGKA